MFEFVNPCHVKALITILIDSINNFRIQLMAMSKLKAIKGLRLVQNYTEQMTTFPHL